MKRLLVIGGAALIITLASFVTMPIDKVVFLDVGQGDSILIASGTQQLLVDGGSDINVLRQLGHELPWFDKTIEMVVLTHPDQDHLAGLIDVINRYHVGCVILPRLNSATALNAEWLQALIKHKIPYRFAQAGQNIAFNGFNINILNPRSAEPIPFFAKDAENDQSVVMRVQYHGLSFLLTGDAAFAAEKNMMASRQTLASNILKVGHHGSKTATSQEFLDAVAPAAAIISVGAKNTYGHPTKEVLDRLKDIFVSRTDQNGAITFKYLHNRWLVKCAKDIFTNSSNSCMKREQT